MDFKRQPAKFADEELMKRIRNWILIAALMGVLCLQTASAEFAAADDVFSSFGALYASQPKLDPSVESKATVEVIQGNGTGAGYVLSYGNVISGSEMIAVAGSSKVRNRDYHIDYSGGTLMFAEPISRSVGIRVSYRYALGTQGERTIVGLPSLQIASSDKMSLGFTYAYRAAAKDSGAPDIMTYGVNTSAKLGGSSQITSMMYMASPQKGGEVIQEWGGNQQAQKPVTEVKSDQLAIHGGDFNFGSLNLKMNFQDVGKDFAGFQSLRDTKAAPADVLAQLEKEKGLKRFDVGGALAITKGLSISGGVNTIKDETGEIKTTSTGLSSNWLKASMNIREVDTEFNRFSDIKESDRDQLAREKGIKRTDLALELAPVGRPKDAAWNKLQMNKIEDTSGAIDIKSASIDTGKLSFSGYTRKVDDTFARINDISGQDRTDFALAIRQQFDPNATVAQVTKKDLDQISKEIGIERSNYRAGLQFGNTSTSFQQLSIGDQSGEIDRQTVKVAGKSYEFFGMRQSIDSDFCRMADLAEVETQQFGNERGIDRTNYGGSYTFGGGKLSTGLSMTKVEDQQSGARVEKRTFTASGQKFNLRANFQEIDQEFGSRVQDLADRDKKKMQSEIGYKLWDLTSGLQLAKGLALDSYYYTAENDTEQKERNQLRNKLTYNGTNGLKVTAFRDDYSFESRESGNIFSYLHDIYTLSHHFGSFKFNLHNEKKTTQEAGADAVTSTVRAEHIESNVKKKTWFSADHKNIDMGDGRFEETTAYKIQSSPMNRMSLSHSFISIEREEGRLSEETQVYGMKWGITKNLNAVSDITRTSVSDGNLFEKRQYGLTGLLGQHILFMRDVKVTAAMSQEKQNGLVINEAESYKMDSIIAKGNLSLDYTAGRNKDGIHPVCKSYRFTSDRNNKRLLFDLHFKDRTDANADHYLIRSCNMGFKLDERTQFTYGYFSNVEKAKGVVDPVKGESLKLTTTVKGGLKLTADYQMDTNMLTGVSGRRHGLGFSGKLHGRTVEVHYGVEDLFGNSIDCKTHTYKLKFEDQLDANHFLTFSGIYSRTNNEMAGADDKEDIEARVDFRTTFR